MIAAKIALELEKLILSGQIKLGSRLPPERKLSQQYNVSRTTIREAIKQIEQLGLVETRPQNGTFVSDYLEEASLDLLIHMMKDPESWDAETLLSLLETRKVIELFAVTKAVSSAQEADIEFLKEYAGNLSSQNPGVSAEMDYKLHYKIMKMSSNIALLLIFNSFKPVYRYLTDMFFNDKQTIKKTMDQHKLLIACFEERNSEKALAVMEDILTFGELTVKEYINGNKN